MIRILQLSLALACVALFSCAAPRTLTLVEDGQPQAVIVIADDATRVAQLAAFELQWHIERISGGKLPIVNEPEDGKIAVVVGAHPLAVETGIAAWKPQEYAIHFTENTIFLVGDDSPEIGEVTYDLEDRWAFTSWPSLEDAQGTLHATYEFLERHADVRWWNPTEFGIDLPSTSTLAVTGSTLRRQPAFSYREIPGMSMAESYDAHTQYWHREAPEYRKYLELAYPELLARWDTVDFRWRGWMQLWLMRMKLGGGERYRANHSFYGWYDSFWEKNPDRPESFESHRPELFAQGYDGHARPPNLCFTSPEAAELAVQEARAYFDEGGYGKPPPTGIGHPGYFWGEDYFAVVPNDSAHCTCERCEALPRPESPFFSRGEHSAEVFGFANQVAKALKQSHPDKYVATLAYAGYTRYPADISLEDNIAVQICLHIRHVYDRAIQENDLEILREWVENEPGRRIYLWLYYTFPLEMGKGWHVFPGFFAHHIDESFKMYHDMGIRGAFFNGFAQGLDAYLTCRMLHDPAENVDDVIDEYFHRQYGAAGDPLKQFYLMVEDIYGNSDNYPVPEKARGLPNTPGIIGHQTNDIAWGHLGTAERMGKLAALMQQAHELAETDLEKRCVAIFDVSLWQYMQTGARRYRVRQALNDGNRLYNEGRFEEAMAELAKVVDEPLSTPDQIARGFVQKGHVFNRQGRRDEALAEFKQAANIADANTHTISDAYRRVGESLIALGRNDEAMVWFERVLELDAHPHHTSQARFIKGKFLYDTSDHKAALEQFEHVLAITNAYIHNVVQAQFHIGWSLVQLNQLEQAIQAFQQVREIDGVSPNQVQAAETELKKVRDMMAERKAAPSRNPQP